MTLRQCMATAVARESFNTVALAWSSGATCALHSRGMSLRMQAGFARCMVACTRQVPNLASYYYGIYFHTEAQAEAHRLIPSAYACGLIWIS
jgi:hypothetical protein